MHTDGSLSIKIVHLKYISCQASALIQTQSSEIAELLGFVDEVWAASEHLLHFPPSHTD